MSKTYSQPGRLVQAEDWVLVKCKTIKKHLHPDLMFATLGCEKQIKSVYNPMCYRAKLNLSQLAYTIHVLKT